MCGFMTKKNPAVHYQDVALEVPEGDLVDLDLLESSSICLEKLSMKHI